MKIWRPQGNWQRAALMAAIGAAAIAGGVYYHAYEGGTPGQVELPRGASLEMAQLETLARLPAFSLQRSGASMTPADLQGRWSYFFFGYTNCPNACPATLAILAHVQETLRSRGIEPPRVVFVSVDPRRDKPEVLSRYVAAFGDDALGATGDDAQLQSLLKFFGVIVEREDTKDPANYTVDHTANIYLVTPDGRWLASFPPAEDAEAVLQDTLTLLHVELPRSGT